MTAATSAIDVITVTTEPFFSSMLVNVKASLQHHGLQTKDCDIHLDRDATLGLTMTVMPAGLAEMFLKKLLSLQSSF